MKRGATEGKLRQSRSPGQKRRKAEALLLQSFKEAYPHWVESGLVRSHERSTSSESHSVLSGKSSKPV